MDHVLYPCIFFVVEERIKQVFWTCKSLVRERKFLSIRKSVGSLMLISLPCSIHVILITLWNEACSVFHVCQNAFIWGFVKVKIVVFFQNVLKPGSQMLAAKEHLFISFWNLISFIDRIRIRHPMSRLNHYSGCPSCWKYRQRNDTFNQKGRNPKILKHYPARLLSLSLVPKRSFSDYYRMSGGVYSEFGGEKVVPNHLHFAPVNNNAVVKRTYCFDDILGEMDIIA